MVGGSRVEQDRKCENKLKTLTPQVGLSSLPYYFRLVLYAVYILLTALSVVLVSQIRATLPAHLVAQFQAFKVVVPHPNPPLLTKIILLVNFPNNMSQL